MRFRVLITVFSLFASFVFAQDNLTSEQLYQEAYENFVKRDYAAASASLDKINPVDQKKADILNLRGAIYKRLGELDNAANAYSDALKVNPKDWVPKYNLAEVNFLREEYKASRTFLEQALASMPEADRLQKQDLILYKVFLTYLMQGDDEKAKLLLDSFDINSANPVYYFAQAAYSFKNKDGAKGKTWVTSTEGLYSQDLRNSYGQALVDIGWMQPSEGVGTALTASAAPTPEATPPTPPQVVAMATPAAKAEATPATADVVPLATNDATPITVAAATPMPEATAEVATSTPQLPDLGTLNFKETQEQKGGFSLTTGLIIVGVLFVAFLWLMNLAKRSRIVPPAEDNTGYDAIVASGSPEAGATVGHSSEGTGPVIEQSDSTAVAPASIKPTPIHREYASTEPVAAPVLPVKASATARTSRAKSAATRTKPAAKPAVTRSKPATAKKPAISKPAATKPATKAKPAAKKVVASPAVADPRRTRVIPVKTINVPPPANAPKLVASNIPTIKLSSTSAPAAAPKTTTKIKLASAPAKTVGKPAAKASSKASSKAPAKSPAPSHGAPLITIPEFEESSLETSPRPVIRLVSDSGKSGNV